MSEEKGTLEEVIEPFLLQEGFISRTPRGRIAAQRAYDHLGLPARGKGKAPDAGQTDLF
jgi:Holliday junction DNA helicase RuvB